MIYDDPTGHISSQLTTMIGYLNNQYVPDCAKKSILNSVSVIAPKEADKDVGFSYWHDNNNQFQYFYNKNTENNAVQVQRIEDNITINAYVDIKVDFNSKLNDSSHLPDFSTSYKQLAVDGIKMWGGNYKVGGQDVTVGVNVYNSDNKKDTNVVNHKGDWLKITITDAYDSNLYGQPTDASVTEYHNSTGWAMDDDDTTITVSTNMVGYNKLEPHKIVPETYPYQFKSIVAHEFGHALGLDEAYADPNSNRKEIPTYNGEVPENDLMRGGEVLASNKIGGRGGKPIVSDNDIEMVMLAQQYNQVQSFVPYTTNNGVSHSTSSAITNIPNTKNSNKK